MKETVNAEDGFKFKIQDVFNYCRKNGISLKHDLGKLRTYIHRYKINGLRKWVVQYRDFAQKKFVILHLSGEDGTLIRTEYWRLPETQE